MPPNQYVALVRPGATRDATRCFFSSLLRRGHKALVHPSAQVGTEPFTGQLSAQFSFLALLINQRSRSGELDADPLFAFVVYDFPVTLPAGVPADEDLTKLANFVPAEMARVDEVEQ